MIAILFGAHPAAAGRTATRFSKMKMFGPFGRDVVY